MVQGRDEIKMEVRSSRKDEITPELRFWFAVGERRDDNFFWTLGISQFVDFTFLILLAK